MLDACRLIHDRPGPGAWNMAVDEALLESAQEEEVATLRFYQWEEPTLSLGYFQRYEDRKLHRASEDLPVVRRCTGGGALVHDRELTYSLTLPPTHPRSGNPVALTCAAHQALIAAVEQLFGDRSLTTCGEESAPSLTKPFLCFLRRSPGDLLTGQNHKVCGSAQRKRRGALLQHGGLLLAKTPAAPELPGLVDIVPNLQPILAPAELQALAQAWGGLLLEAVGLKGIPSELTDRERERAANFHETRHRNADWMARR